jgi:hypothetical protein
MPLAWLEVGQMPDLAIVGNLVLLVTLCIFRCACWAARAGCRASQCHSPWRRFAVWCEPVWTTLRYGQINPLLAVLVLWDPTRRNGHRWAGCAGLAVAVAAQLAGDRLPHASARAAVTCAVTALLISPVSWSHHWVWGVPMVLLPAAEATRRRDVRWAAGAVLSGLLFSSHLL